jgi:hypothetical protein
MNEEKPGVKLCFVNGAGVIVVADLKSPLGKLLKGFGSR